MKKNMGMVDRVLRIIIAAVIAYLVFSGVITGLTGILLSVLAFIFVVTSLFGSCPLYSLFGMSTRSL